MMTQRRYLPGSRPTGGRPPARRLLARIASAAAVVLMTCTAASAANVQVRLIRGSGSGSGDGRLGDVNGVLKSRGMPGTRLVQEQNVSLSPGQSRTLNFAEQTRVVVTNEGESGGRYTLRVQAVGWGGAVTYRLQKNRPALIVGPSRGSGRLVLAVKAR